MEENEINHYPSVKQSWGVVGLCILFSILFGVPHFFLSRIAGEEFSFLIYYLLSMGTVFWIAHLKRKKLTYISVYNFDFSSAKTIVLVSISVIAIQIGIISPIVSLVPMPEFMKNVFIEFAKRNGVFSFIAIVLAAPLLEELIFRGIILDGFLKRYTPLRSILISSALFGIVHLNPWQFISALIIGIFSGWVYYKTRMVTLSIVIHLVNNLAAFSSMYFLDAEATMDMSLMELYGGFLNFAVITFGAILAAVICLYFLRLEIMTMKTSQEAPRALL